MIIVLSDIVLDTTSNDTKKLGIIFLLEIWLNLK
jgi:hypothetical protein